MGLRERVQAILAHDSTTTTTSEERVHQAIDEIADEVDRVSTRLAIIDPEWEVIARRPIDDDQAEELLR